MLVPSRKACEILGVHPNTLRKWHKEGKIQAVRMPGGNRRFDVNSILQTTMPKKKIICYCRVSSRKQIDDLERQVQFMKANFKDAEVIQDVGSGLNFKRKGLLALIKEINQGTIGTVVVAHRDRLCRFGFDLFQWICNENDTKLLVLNELSLSPEEELTRDLLSIIHVFSCRVNGLRSYRTRIKEDSAVSK